MTASAAAGASRWGAGSNHEEMTCTPRWDASNAARPWPWPSSRGRQAMSGDIFGYRTWGGVCAAASSGRSPGMPPKHPVVHSPAFSPRQVLVSRGASLPPVRTQEWVPSHQAWGSEGVPGPSNGEKHMWVKTELTWNLLAQQRPPCPGQGTSFRTLDPPTSHH